MFNSLPAEVNDWDMIFRDRAGLLCDLEDTVQFLAQCRHIPSDLVIGDFGINLCCGDAFMSQHLADCLQRYALRERNRCGKGVPRHVESDRLGKEKRTGEDKT